MRQLFIIVALAFASLASASGIITDDKDMSWKDDMPGEIVRATMLYNNDDPEQGLAILEPYVKRFNANPELGDSLYARLFTINARCRFAKEDVRGAIGDADRAIKLWGEHCDTLSTFYAIILDNLSYYLMHDKRYEDAVAMGERSCAIYDRLFINDYDKAVVLFHLAEACGETNRHDKAISYENLALNILKREKGEHSKAYIDELDYLSAYYKKAGKDADAEAVDELKSKLTKEASEGKHDIPSPIESDDPAEYRAHTKDALFCANYYLSHAISAPGMFDAAMYCMAWGAGCDDVTLFVGKEETKMLASENVSLFCAFAYYLGCVKYAIEHKQKDFSYDMYVNGVMQMVDFYNNNDAVFASHKVAYVEKYINALNKSAEQFDKLLKKNFQLIKDDASMHDASDKIRE